MNTAFLLMAQYGATAVIPLDAVCRDYFPHLKIEQFVRKLGSGEIKLPVTRMEPSQKSAKGVHLTDLAKYIEERREAAVKELRQMTQ